ncbi:MAG: metal-sensing transcriptional repressor [Candidatus Magasanikbacteria bacterium]|nr:metal-sensing transcriptional repressor [Candidatus Magasanikbacteria bacterium]
MIDNFRQEAIRGLKKARGQLETALAMLEENRYCIDIIQQTNAVMGILRQANNRMLEAHLHSCGHKLHSQNAAEKEQFIKEIIRVCTVSNRKP